MAHSCQNFHDPEHSQHGISPSSVTTSSDDPSSSSSSPPSTSQVQEEVENEHHDEDGDINHHHRHHHHHHHRHHYGLLLDHHQERQQQQPSALTYRVNISISDAPSTQIRDDVWSCLVVLVTFWFFAASMTLIFGFYGSVNLQMGPNCSRLIQTNPFLVQSIDAEEINEPKPGPMLYGFYKQPPLDVEITWTETHNTFVPASFHKELVYFLNKGSRVDITYHVKSPSSSPLSLVIAQGRESLVEWIEDPSYPNTTLSWNIIYGSGKIQQKIPESSNYYIAVGNLHSEEVEVELKFTINAFLYNTTTAYYKCSLGNRLCSLKLFLLGTNSAVLTSPHRKEDTDDDWFVKLSYGPRWIAYFVGSGVMTVLILSVFRFLNAFQTTAEDGTIIQPGEVGTERTPLLLHKDDDVSSWGSSYDSVSHDEEDPEEQLAVNCIDGQQITEGENSNNTQRLCVICFDASRDCFFLPCGHCAACFTCGKRIAEEAGNCPICRRKMKKVRKIFTV